MSTSKILSSRRAALRTALLTLGCALSLTCGAVTALNAAESVTPMASDKAPSLPLTATFAKGTPGERGGPFVLNLKNNSQESLKVHGKVQYAVAYHMNEKGREIAPHTIAAGETWSITDLAAGDKVALMAPGFAPLELEVK